MDNVTLKHVSLLEGYVGNNIIRNTQGPQAIVTVLDARANTSGGVARYS